MKRAEILRWLESREPKPPEALARRLDELVSDCPPVRLSDALAELALRALASLDGRAETDVALDLLAADALVTYAFEAAAEQESDAAAVADSILARIEA